MERVFLKDGGPGSTARSDRRGCYCIGMRSHGIVVRTPQWARAIMTSQTLHSHHVPPLPPGTKSPPPQLKSAVLISRQSNRDTPAVVKDIFSYVTDRAHAEAFCGPPLWGSGVPRSDSDNRFGHLATKSCAKAVPGSTRHRDRYVFEFSRSRDINVQYAIKVLPSTRGAPL